MIIIKTELGGTAFLPSFLFPLSLPPFIYLFFLSFLPLRLSRLASVLRSYNTLPRVQQSGSNK